MVSDKVLGVAVFLRLGARFVLVFLLLGLLLATFPVVFTKYSFEMSEHVSHRRE